MTFGSNVVLADIRQQINAGAQHITFGDPDFFNGPGHAMRVAEAFHAEFPNVTYDATIKVEHLLAQRDKMGRLAETGCLFVTTAVEEVDDRVLAKLDKGHTRADFIEVVGRFFVVGGDVVLADIRQQVEAGALKSSVWTSFTSLENFISKCPTLLAIESWRTGSSAMKWEKSGVASHLQR